MTMSMNQIFKKVSKHLLKQNKKSLRMGHEMCQYRTPAGLSCAVGCLMTDAMYSPEFEGKGLTAGLQKALTPVLGVKHKKRLLKITLLRRLQSIHDNNDPAKWPRLLGALKQEFTRRGEV
jgi:hypothetical protein